MRVVILAVPPVIPLIHDELQMSETQVGLLIGLPVMTFALAAVPGSLLIARFGASLTMVTGLLIAALGGGARGIAVNIWTLYAATMLMGFGIAITQPALPALVRDWLPRRMGFATTVSTNGMLVGSTLAPTFTIPYLLPLTGRSWRLDLILWGAPVLLAALLFFLFSPLRERKAAATENMSRWWPDWKQPLIWLLGIGLGANNSVYFGTNAFLPDYLAHIGRLDLLGPALGWLNGAQLLATVVLMLMADRIFKRTWPYLVFGAIMFFALLGVVVMNTTWIVICAAVVGFATAVTFVIFLALPPVMSAPGDVHRTAAGMFTISFSCAVVIPTICGILWDLTGIPWIAFVPLCLCAITVTGIGTLLSFYQPRVAQTSS